MNITDVLVSVLIKKGILYEARNCDIGFDIPTTKELVGGGTKDDKIHIQFKAEHMTLRIDKSKDES